MIEDAIDRKTQKWKDREFSGRAGLFTGICRLGSESEMAASEKEGSTKHSNGSLYVQIFKRIAQRNGYKAYCL